MLWIAIALMTGATVLCVVWPMSQPRTDTATSCDIDLRFYREQMRALDLDAASGLVGSAEAAGSRAEIGRRLIAASERADSLVAAPGRRRRLLGAAVVVMLAIPAISLGLYAAIGAPDQEDMPLATRQDRRTDFALTDAIAKVEAHLAKDPSDGRGFEVLAPLYLRLNRFADAARAYERTLALLGETAGRRTGYGQALMLQADGVVTAEARAAFEQAANDDPAAFQPKFFIGLAAMQDGDKSRARATWTSLVDQAPPDAPWLPMLQSQLAALDGAPAISAGPSSSAGAAIAALPVQGQQQAIRGMVDGLAARLAQNGRDKDGWLRLVRAYTVLGERTKAETALADARRTLADNPQGLTQLDGLARELGLGGRS